MYYDKFVKENQYNVGERVLLWSNKLKKEEGKKLVKPCIGPYNITKRLGRVAYEWRSEMGNQFTTVHVNRLRRIGEYVVETGDPEAGMFPDSLRLFKISLGSRYGRTKTHVKTKNGSRSR